MSKQLLELIENPNKLYKQFSKIIDEIDRLNKDKNSLTEKELHHNYNIINKRFLKIRNVLRMLIVDNDKLYKKHFDYCEDNFLYWILLDGFSYDINKNTTDSPLMAFIPYKNQLPLIDSLTDESTINVHVEKSRRQGASKIFILFMVWLLIFGKNEVMYATHKDLDSLDKIEGDLGHNSTFDNVRWLLDKSIFVAKDWRDGLDKGDTQQKQINLNSNVLMGAVLGKGTAVGMAGTRIFVDEIDVVCDMFPNQAKSIVGSFSMSVNHVYLYSTYRSMEYPFYQFKVNRDNDDWKFFRLDWKDNPTCNVAWYNRAKSKMGNDPVLVARELDIDPTKIREGSIFGDKITDKNYYNSINQIVNYKDLRKVIGADFGGGTSLTSFVLGYLNARTGELYIDDIIESTQYNAEDIRAKLYEKGFNNIIVYADSSCSAQIGAKGHDWKTLLGKVNVNLIPVSNQSPYIIHALINEQIREGKIFINKSNNLLMTRITSYRYKEDKVLKDANSHFGDAITYLYKGLFVKTNVGFIE